MTPNEPVSGRPATADDSAVSDVFAPVDWISDGSEPPRGSTLLLSVQETAHLLGISRAYAYQLVLRGDLPSVKLGRLRKVRRIDVIRFVDEIVLNC